MFEVVFALQMMLSFDHLFLRVVDALDVSVLAVTVVPISGIATVVLVMFSRMLWQEG